MLPRVVAFMSTENYFLLSNWFDISWLSMEELSEIKVNS